MTVVVGVLIKRVPAVSDQGSAGLVLYDVGEVEFNVYLCTMCVI